VGVNAAGRGIIDGEADAGGRDGSMAEVREGDSSGCWWVYVLTCADGTYYVGMTTDVIRRLCQHGAGRGARYTRTRLPVTLAGLAVCGGRSEAMRLEARLKRSRRPAKERFVREHPPPSCSSEADAAMERAD
jgi:putative endonuclease